jgi:large subunit ribosomal protein L21
MEGKQPVERGLHLRLPFRNWFPIITDFSMAAIAFEEVKTMAHAVIKSGGKQFLVEEGQTLRVPSLTADAGSSVELEALLTTATEASKISATVVDHGRDQKIVVFKKKRRKQYKRTRGHRQGYTTLKIDSIG